MIKIRGVDISLPDTREDSSFTMRAALPSACKPAIQIIIIICFIAAFGASQRNAYYLHGVRNYEFGVGLRKVVEHNTLAVVGARP